jgi:hypothetical protein
VTTVPFHEELFGLAMDFSSSPELPALKKRFEGFGACKDHATAAAFGYLAAMKDAEAKEEEPTIADSVCAIIEQAMEGEMDAEYAGDLIMGLVYKWLYKELRKDDWNEDDYIFTLIKSLFMPFVKPGVIKQ